ncbi:TPA: hypothetical protein RQJ52_002773 [Vibrio vulnificus]|nr:hypothetical protein [Vibrio vulnificus]HDY7464352.1 hypothetical protein [Vibrio vulnificus]HDY7627976.1 hypothetical protein [Vibrio vulnificus]
MKNLSGRKVLFFCPSFYNYREMISEEMEVQGAEVFSYDERPSNNTIFKILLRLKAKIIIKNIIFNYYSKITTSTYDEEITDVFFINAEAVNYESLLLLKGRYKNAKFTLYMWDSLNNKSGLTDVLPMFDNVLSFDKKDCEYNERINFEPLFYGRNFEKEDNNKEDINISFIGSIHSDRLMILNKIKQRVDDGYFYLFSPSKIFTLIKFVQYKIFSFESGFVKHKKIKASDVSNIFNRSHSVLDINHPKQTGLTMRTFEVLGAGKKLITTNENIKEYQFYDESRVHVLERSNINFNQLDSFLKSKNTKYAKLTEYRIDNWIKRVLK